MTTKVHTNKEINLAILKPGATVKIYEKIKETAREKSKKGKEGKEERERLQLFEGIILAHKHGGQAGATITVRKISNGIGVEKIFPIHSPVIEKMEVVKNAKVRRAKLYYLRDYKKKLKEIK